MRCTYLLFKSKGRKTMMTRAEENIRLSIVDDVSFEQKERTFHADHIFIQFLLGVCEMLAVSLDVCQSELVTLSS